MPIPKVTEAPNSITSSIDVATPQEIIELLCKCDNEMFDGFNGSEGLLNAGFLGVMEKVSDVIAEILKNHSEDGAIICTGSGTSGRLAFFVSRIFNNILKENGRKPIFHYLIAGGDYALQKAREGAEDSCTLAIKDLNRLENEFKYKKALIIGITCGLSATYSGTHVDYGMDHSDVYTSCILGFNPVESVNPIKIENWAKTFHEVLHRVLNTEGHYLINPVVGPEPITGSTRMKSGSATKIILECLFASACHKAFGLELKKTTQTDMMKEYQLTVTSLYGNEKMMSELSKMIALAGEALNLRKRVVYLGENNFGRLGLVDASECPPTFGASFEDIQGFLFGGWDALGNVEGPQHISGFPIDVDSFEKQILPKLTKGDLVICLGTRTVPKAAIELAKKAHDNGASVGVITVAGDLKIIQDSMPTGSIIIDVQLPESSLTTAPEEDCLLELASKLLLNAVSTGAHVLRGTVYRNRMVNLTVTNAKLYHRAIGVIRSFSSVDEPTAESALLRAIYRTDEISEEIKVKPISQHISISAETRRVVPLALLLALIPEISVSDALQMIVKNPVLRDLISKLSES